MAATPCCWQRPVASARRSCSSQRELPWSLAAEARYVGTFGREIWRGIDYNQIEYSQEFLDDVIRARTNGYLAQQAGLAWSPVFNANVPGSQPLTMLPSLGLPLTNSTVVQPSSRARSDASRTCT